MLIQRPLGKFVSLINSIGELVNDKIETKPIEDKIEASFTL